jgi:hypothetical protein
MKWAFSSEPPHRGRSTMPTPSRLAPSRLERLSAFFECSFQNGQRFRPHAVQRREIALPRANKLIEACVTRRDQRSLRRLGNAARKQFFFRRRVSFSDYGFAFL